MTRVLARAAAVVALLVLAAGCGPTADPNAVFGRSVNVGLAKDTPGWGEEDAGTNRRGFDNDLSNWLGAQLGFTPVPVNVSANNRETDLQPGGRVQLVVATYSITDARRKLVGQAGPYMITKQGFMVRAADHDKYPTLSSFAGKTVCTEVGSTSEKQLTDSLGFSVTKVLWQSFSPCVDDLLANRVDAISTDQLLLYGLAKNEPRLYVPPGIVFGHPENYGVGYPRGDRAKCLALTAKLKEFIINGYWDSFFVSNLPNMSTTDHKPDPQHLDPC